MNSHNGTGINNGLGKMKFGVFMAPFHRLGESPFVSLQRDLELIQWMDELGLDEAWIGEHHSGAWENITDPTVFIAAAAERTHTIKLGTGVISLPYHHPLNTADRLVLLDYLSRGRFLFGAGPGVLVHDAVMMGIDPNTQRRRMDEAMGVIIRLLHGERVTYKCDWFELNDAYLHLLPYTQPCFPIFVAGVQTPSGPTVAGKYGVGLLGIASTAFGGLGDYASMWRIAEESAAKNNQTVSRADWRLVIPIHLADSKQEAMRDVAPWYYQKMHEYSGSILGGEIGSGEDSIDSMVEKGLAIVGTPDDAIETIRRLQETSGGFGGLLGISFEWGSRESIKHSYELMARYVAPHFQGLLRGPEMSARLMAAGALELVQLRIAATVKAIDEAEVQQPEAVRLAAGAGRLKQP
jgi:limonene 1,2-monooxygenase